MADIHPTSTPAGTAAGTADAPPLIQDFREPDALAASARTVMVKATPLSPDPFRQWVVTLRQGEASLQVTRVTPSMAFVGLAPTRAGLVVPLGNYPGLLLNGRPAMPATVGAYGTGGEFVRANPQAGAHIMLSIAPAQAEALLCPRAGAPMLRPGAEALLATDPAAHARLTGIGLSLAAIGHGDPSRLAVPAARAGLVAALLDAAREVLGRGQDTEHGRRRLARHAWLGIVRRAEDVLQADPGRAIYTEELCAVLGVSPTSLVAAFRNVLGMTPHRFLKLRRLAMVRAALLAQDGPPPLIKAVALAHGFWHLGQFALDYRAAYGETPSETLARGQDASGRTSLRA